MLESFGNSLGLFDHADGPAWLALNSGGKACAPDASRFLAAKKRRNFFEFFLFFLQKTVLARVMSAQLNASFTIDQA
ncbi:MAG: hypothetical protein N4A65_12185 [Cohaesibacter sp.]|jgi:hypothetical protein|nr:hypothetical protein [Cohaesibacter sp.]